MITVGRIRVHLLNDGFFGMDGGAMFGVVPKPLWSKHVPADEENRIPMSLHCPLAIDGRDAILVDTGLGDRLSERERSIYRVDRRGGLEARLAEAGLAPEDVTHVILTHLHFDHLGGVIRRDGAGRPRAAFPRARHFVQRLELEAAERPQDARSAAAYEHAAECLAPLRGAGLLEVLDGPTSLGPRLRIVVTGGHTPSHQCPILTDAGEGFVHLGDVAPTRAHMRPAWNQAYDLSPLETMSAKRSLLEHAARERWWVSFDHDHQIACGRLAPGWGKSGELVDPQPLAPPVSSSRPSSSGSPGSPR
jgi:glyoxylase-like metal-dependent hydrolase (beta-lactamase superfamily II)